MPIQLTKDITNNLKWSKLTKHNCLHQTSLSPSSIPTLTIQSSNHGLIPVQQTEDISNYSKPCISGYSKRPKMVFRNNYCLMQGKSIAECSKGSILQYFWSSLRSLFEWLFYTGFTWFSKWSKSTKHNCLHHTQISPSRVPTTTLQCSTHSLIPTAEWGHY